MKYKKGDKVVVEIKFANRTDKFLPYEVGHSQWISNSDVLGKLSDYNKQNKIKFTEEEKAEFDDIRLRAKELLKALMVITKACTCYPHLKKWILEDDHPLPRNEREILFAKAWEHPELIEVKKEKKYYVHLFKLQKYGYLNKNKINSRYFVDTMEEMDDAKTQFTKDEIENINDLGFKINDDALEEVEDDIE